MTSTLDEPIVLEDSWKTSKHIVEGELNELATATQKIDRRTEELAEELKTIKVEQKAPIGYKAGTFSGTLVSLITNPVATASVLVEEAQTSWKACQMGYHMRRGEILARSEELCQAKEKIRARKEVMA